MEYDTKGGIFALVALLAVEFIMAAWLLIILRRFIDIVAFCQRDENGFSVPSVWYRDAEGDD